MKTLLLLASLLSLTACDVSLNTPREVIVVNEYEIDPEYDITNPTVTNEVISIGNSLTYVNSTTPLYTEDITLYKKMNTSNQTLAKTLKANASKDWVEETSTSKFATGETAYITSTYTYYDEYGYEVDEFSASEIDYEIYAKGSSFNRSISTDLSLTQYLPKEEDLVLIDNEYLFSSSMTLNGKVTLIDISNEISTDITNGEIYTQYTTNAITYETLESDFEYKYSFHTRIGSSIYSGTVKTSSTSSSDDFNLFGSIYKDGINIGYIGIDELGNIDIYDLNKKSVY